ncbi:MAG: type IV pilin-like G/H family protein [Microcoleus sp. PH2017_10_PVI_O_A]|uniref:type IV pilin-like G/H family protein n=1 Tax=unclassified Microcoleus TaxID=2642155 RepID=UPI001DA1317C|nr:MULTISPECIES: type IV pilin-like G/H family protein [unclassified Microcoleus]TAE85305.1 MAG: general secretion pathway protein GspH [Oscillatoriales cyanobacterium]MCC3406859.1 type IV pilin-like G/H family protein [Microcoleus sp. PH2017_10_PVI_O_A]MCC3458786.1 type IV pilin-like G/H family protein [Microcoleus sp. PH2017_11_PCY_U_A]MCC3476985.1 type IV pilin-like G/H family protein [Microcoleus sp. PH2017_12_PCY_D_A]MCC3558182.1 type IV pilin-like G/H family protein [Microcoleus sp. PH20
MSQRDYNSPSFLPTTGCGCLVLLILLTPVIGVLVLSFFLCGNTNKAKQSEAKQYVGSMNRAQQAYYAENGVLGNSVAALGIGIKTETTNYKYSLRSTKTTAFNYALSKQEKEKSFVGGVFLVPAYPNAPKHEMTTSAILCEADSSGTIKPAEPTEQNDKLICGKGTTQVTK